jgi:mono/diheme cytochrome c family protein
MRTARSFLISGLGFLAALMLVTEFGIRAEKTAAAPAENKGKTVGFSRDIQPIFNSYCVACHGPDMQQKGLRLDSADAVLKGSTTGKVVVPADSSGSPLIRRLLGQDKPQMPFLGQPLDAEQIALIRAWIDQGAPAGPSAPSTPAVAHKHWAYVKPVPPEQPKVRDTSWCRNPIDHFVLARLDKEGLKPSPEASKETLIRRLSLDLIGLPPTPKEVDTFLADKSPEAYDQLVDRLLASPHYGERWARPWLDIARYADTNGYEKDGMRTAWEYRDWLIRALNQDMSYREFTIEQIAGDMLPHPSTDKLIATGFHRNTMLNQEGGVDSEEYRWYSLVDRVNTTATVWLGATLACSQCHDHKFDPFTRVDYYRFMAFFDNEEYKALDLGQGEGWVEEPILELPTPEQEAKSKELKAEISKLQTVLNTSTPELETAQAKWETDLAQSDSHWSVVRPARVESQRGSTLTVLDDDSVLASGKNPDTDVYTVEAHVDQTRITGVRLEVLDDPRLPHGGPGRDPDGNFFLSGLEFEAAPGPQSQAGTKVEWKEAVADESLGGYSVRNLASASPELRGWSIDNNYANPPSRRQAVLIPKQPFGFENGTVLTIRLKQEMRFASRNIGRFRLSVTTIADPKEAVNLPARLRPVLSILPEKRTAQQRQDMAAAYRAVSPLLDPERKRIAELGESLDKLGIVTALVMHERAGFERPSTAMHVRGSFAAVGEKVFAGVPKLFGPMPDDVLPNRLGLAEWLVSDDNPLAARVEVNRLWETIWGRGIVETSEDFGTQGSPPTHPELLDWLATEFMRQGWSMKKVVRLIVTSSTYRQSSVITPELEERDPYNRLLARGPRFRVEGEMVRDIALGASGLLNLKMGGPSVFPYQPEGIWDRPYSDEKWVLSEGEDRYRRAVYTFMRRTAPYPSLDTFDAPSREFCTVRRVRTNTPLQALTTLNDPAYFEAARTMARRILKEGKHDDPDRVRYGFRLAVSRTPTELEAGRVLAYYQQELAHFRGDRTAALEVLGYKEKPAGKERTMKKVEEKGEKKAEEKAEKKAEEKTQPALPPPANAPELAAWTMVSNVLLNLDETITKE